MLIVSLIVLQLFIFAVLIFILRHILTRNVVSSTQHLEKLCQDYSKKQEEIKKQFQEAKQFYRETKLKARQEAEEFKARLIKEAEAEKEKIIQLGRSQAQEIIQQADNARNQLISELEDRIEARAIEQACELTQQVLPLEVRQEVHTRRVRELIKNGFEQLDTTQVPGDIQEAKVVSAFALTKNERNEIKRRLKEKLGRDFNFKEEVRSDIIGGLIINLGSLVLDGSLRYEIQEVAKNVRDKDRT